MCIVTLSMLNRCRHELATIEYCKKADKKVEEKDIANDKSGKLPKPRQACTESLGWLIYKTLDAPVTCESCKKWLAKKDKRTYGDVFEDRSKETGDDVKCNALTTSAQRRRQPSEAVHAANGARCPTQLGSPAARAVGDPYD